MNKVQASEFMRSTGAAESWMNLLLQAERVGFRPPALDDDMGEYRVLLTRYAADVALRKVPA